MKKIILVILVLIICVIGGIFIVKYKDTDNANKAEENNTAVSEETNTENTDSTENETNNTESNFRTIEVTEDDFK